MFAQHQGGAVQPAGDAHRLQIGHHVKIAVAPLPVRVAIAGDRIHLHIHGQQVIAGVRPVPRHVIEEIIRRRTAFP